MEISKKLSEGKIHDKKKSAEPQKKQEENNGYFSDGEEQKTNIKKQVKTTKHQSENDW